MIVNLLQYIGTIILILHKFPQIYRAYKCRDKLEGFSITKFTMGAIGGIFMGLWGAVTNNWGIVGLNIFCTTYETIILALVLRLKLKKKDEIQDYEDEFRRTFE